MVLQKNMISLQANAQDKKHATELAFSLLHKNDFVTEKYLQSMYNREDIAQTFLGNGIAIPHGMRDDTNLVHKTGVAIVQIPDGVDWGEGVVHIVVGIAANSTDHIEILKKLTKIVMDADLAKKLAHTKDVNDFIAAMGQDNQTEITESKKSIDSEKYPYQTPAVFGSREGMHARPASAISEFAKNNTADFVIEYNGNIANAKSVASLLTLGVPAQATITIATTDKSALLDFASITEKNHDADIDTSAKFTDTDLPTFMPSDGAIKGISASNGITKAHAFQFVSHNFDAILDDCVTVKSPDKEAKDLQSAIDESLRQLDTLKNTVSHKISAQDAKIFTAHKDIISDEEIIQNALQNVSKGLSAAQAWNATIDKNITAFKNSDSKIATARISDLQDIKNRILAILSGQDSPEISYPQSPFILIANDLTPSETASIPTEHLQGIVTVLGGADSHTAIIAKSMGIPAVVATHIDILNIKTTDSVAVNGHGGFIEVNPAGQVLEDIKVAQKAYADVMEQYLRETFKPAITTDNHRIEVVANAANVADIEKAIALGAEGIGLLRTELLFQNNTVAPTDAEYDAVFKSAADVLSGLPVIIRTFDIGGDKPVPFMEMQSEENPFLGMRGIRLMRAYPDVFETQLRAIYRAVKNGLNAKIMIPMITTLEDWHFANKFMRKAQKAENAPDIEKGIMIEVPSTVLLADSFAKEVDFFSVGTNDLTQYILATDRLHPQLSQNTDSLHPAVLNAIKIASDAAHKNGKWIGVCGNMASDPLSAKILTGLGIDELSVSGPNAPLIKSVLRNTAFVNMQDIAKQACECVTAGDVRKLNL